MKSSQTTYQFNTLLTVNIPHIKEVYRVMKISNIDDLLSDFDGEGAKYMLENVCANIILAEQNLIKDANMTTANTISLIDLSPKKKSVQNLTFPRRWWI